MESGVKQPAGDVRDLIIACSAVCALGKWRRLRDAAPLKEWGTYNSNAANVYARPLGAQHSFYLSKNAERPAAHTRCGVVANMRSNE